MQTSRIGSLRPTQANTLLAGPRKSSVRRPAPQMAQSNGSAR